MVAEVIAGKSVDELEITAEVGDGDRQDLAIARGVRQCARALEEVGRIRCEECGGDQGRQVVAGAGACDDLVNVARVADRELMDDVVRIGEHRLSVDVAPDTALTRDVGRTVRG